MKGRFFINPADVKKGTVRLNEKESHHAVSVLRIKTGDVVELLDGTGNSFRGVVSEIRDKSLFVAVDNTNCSFVKPITPLVQITLAASVIKPDAMELLIQKACELGVAGISPILTERCVVRLSQERWQLKYERWKKIALESCKQCGRPAPPDIRPVQSVVEFLKKSSSYDRILIPTLALRGEGLVSGLNKLKLGSVCVMIGPEGDFTPGELRLATDAGARPISLGPWVLRSETAVMFAVSAIDFYYRECVDQ